MRSHVWRILASQSLSSLGTSMSTVALAFMVYKLTGSMLDMGAVMAVSILPLAITSWIAGALLDRYSSKNLMVIADLGRAMLIFLMPILARQSIALIYIVAALIGIFSAVFNPGQIKLIGDLTARGDLVRANSYLAMSRDGAELIGYMGGGALVAVVGYLPAFGVDAASYVLSALLLVGLPGAVPREGPAPRISTLVAESPQVFARLWRNPSLRTNLLLAVFALSAASLYVPNSYGLVLDVFKQGGFELGLLEWAIACGLILGGFVISRMSLAGDKNAYVMYSAVLYAFCLLGVYFSHLLWLSIGLLGLAGAVGSGMSVPSITLVQEASAAEDKGRLIALRGGFGQLSAALAYIVGGLLGDKIGIQNVFFVSGSAAIILGLLIYIPYRISAGRRANTAWQQALAAGETRVVARRAATQAAFGGHSTGWPTVTDISTEEQS